MAKGAGKASARSGGRGGRAAAPRLTAANTLAKKIAALVPPSAITEQQLGMVLADLVQQHRSEIEAAMTAEVRVALERLRK